MASLKELINIERIRSWNRWTLAVAVLLIILTVGLAVRADDEYRWSDWGFGDAQTMLSLRQWNEGGWLHNYLLFKPQGYAKVIDLLDSPDLRHHAHGTCPGSSPNVGPRLWYTHYPAGYLVPYAVLFRLGLDSLFAVRLLSIVLSVGALALMYALFARIANPAISFIAVLFYGLSSAYLGYADSLANQPIDDFLRFGFMLAVVLSTRAATDQLRNRWLIAAWVMEFCLSLASFDSVFFLYAWLIGWDLLEGKGFRWKRYLLFACAPVSAHGLQFLQNVWYLGFKDAVLDIKDAFLLKHGSDAAYNQGQGKIAVIITSVQIIFQNIFNPVWLIVPVLALYAVFARFLKKESAEFPGPALLLVLFLSGLAFVLVLPHAARMPYEARQMMPFTAVLIGAFTWSFPHLFRKALHHDDAAGHADGAPRVWIAAPYLLLTMIVLLVIWFRFAFMERVPVYELGPKKEEMVFAQQLQLLPTRYEPVYFDVGGFSIYWDPTYVPGYPQIMPLTEYYAGSRPILCFLDPERTAEDIVTMVRKSREPFSPVLTARDDRQLEQVLDALAKAGLLNGRPGAFPQNMGRYAADLTDFVRWRDHEADTHSRKP